MVTSITNAREMDSVLPNRVNVSYLDYDREYDANEQYAQRLNKDSVNITSLDLAVVLTATEAAQCAEVLLYMYWLERNDLSFSLPPTYNQLEPGDVITINANEGTYSVRLTEINYTPEGRLECKAKYNSQATYASSAVGGTSAAPPQTLAPAGNSNLVLLDIPCLIDAYNLTGYIAALTGPSSVWPGGVVYRSDDGGQSWVNLQGFTSPGSEMGSATNTIGVTRTDIFDSSSRLQVSLVKGSLAPESELNVLNGSNWFAYGADGRWEIIGVKTPTLQGDGTYIFTDILRGRKGTEWAMGLHQAGDDVVLLDSNSVAFITANTSAITAAKIYRGVTSGKPIDLVSNTNFTYQGVNLECLSPIYLNGTMSPTNNWTLTWVRRSRIDVEWRDNVDVSIGETAEQYIVEFYSSATYTTLKHTSAILTTPTYTYAGASQVTDFGSVQTTLYCKIYQLSSVVGKGYPLVSSLTKAFITVLLMHMDDVALTDAYGHATVLNGNVTRSSTQSKFGGYSGYFDGTGDYIDISSSFDFSFGVGDFTIECWLYLSAVPSVAHTIFDKSISYGGNQVDVRFEINSGMVPSLCIGPTPAWFGGATAIPITTWRHVAFTRQGTTLRSFINGVIASTQTTSLSIGSLSSSARIGATCDGGTNGTNGYIEELRISRVCRYTADFSGSLQTSQFTE